MEMHTADIFRPQPPWRSCSLEVSLWAVSCGICGLRVPLQAWGKDSVCAWQSQTTGDGPSCVRVCMCAGDRTQACSGDTEVLDGLLWPGCPGWMDSMLGGGPRTVTGAESQSQEALGSSSMGTGLRSGLRSRVGRAAGVSTPHLLWWVLRWVLAALSPGWKGARAALAEKVPGPVVHLSRRATASPCQRARPHTRSWTQFV